MVERILTDDPELQAHFDAAGTTGEVNERGQVAVSNWPAVRDSNPNWLNEEWEHYKREHPIKGEAPTCRRCAGDGVHLKLRTPCPRCNGTGLEPSGSEAAAD